MNLPAQPQRLIRSSRKKAPSRRESRQKKFPFRPADGVFLWAILDRRHKPQSPRMTTLRILLLSMLCVAAGVAADPQKPVSNTVIVEKGGTGPYSAMVTEEATLPGMTIFRPSDLTPFGGERKLPILLWGNGACANTTFEHK